MHEPAKQDTKQEGGAKERNNEETPKQDESSQNTANQTERSGPQSERAPGYSSSHGDTISIYVASVWRNKKNTSNALLHGLCALCVRRESEAFFCENRNQIESQGRSICTIPTKSKQTQYSLEQRRASIVAESQEARTGDPGRRGTSNHSAATSADMMQQQQQEERPTVVIFVGGWSPGPILHLIPFLRKNERVLNVQWMTMTGFPMPPIPSAGWCCNLYFLAMTMAFVAVLSFLSHRGHHHDDDAGFRALMVLAIVAWVLVWGRLIACVAVRISMRKGVDQLKRIVQHQRHPTVVVGFSWGGAVVAEYLHHMDSSIGAAAASIAQNDELHSSSTPSATAHVGRMPSTEIERIHTRNGSSDSPLKAALLIAPTTSLIASVAMDRDVAVRMAHRASAIPIHVVHGSLDGSFCPNQWRWEHAPVELHTMEDNHVFFHPTSKRQLAQILVDLVRQ